MTSVLIQWLLYYRCTTLLLYLERKITRVSAKLSINKPILKILEKFSSPALYSG